MAAMRLSMRKIREILRLHFEHRLSNRLIARSISASTSTVAECLWRAKLAGIGWPPEPELDDATLESKLYPTPTGPKQVRSPLDFDYIRQELHRKGVTLQLLWEEYKQSNPDSGYSYSRFCEHYSRFRATLDVVLRQNHRAGEKMFVDFSGDGIEIVNRVSGQITEAELFVAVLGASNYSYVEAFESQQLRCWIEGHIHAFEYFGGVPAITVPDNTKTAVIEVCRYEPGVNLTYLEMANYYNTAVIPARPGKPRDKAKVENGVLIAQRWILAALRNHRFFSLQETNQAIREKLEELNNRRFKNLDTTRRQMFETLEKPVLQPLPPGRYEFAIWSDPRVNVDYHVEVEKHYYSVPYSLVQKKVEARTTATTVEILYKGQRVACHERSFVKGGYTTLKEHMPQNHRQYVEWTPQRIQNWAAQAGPATGQLAEKILTSKPHPQQGFRACLGLIRLGKLYGKDRLEAACGRALAAGAFSYKSVKSILQNGLDRQPLPQQPEQMTLLPVEHENLRGASYYN